MQAELSNPQMAVSDGLGNIYFSDSANAVIHKINSSGTISTIAGNGTRGTAGDGGPALSANIGFVDQLALGGGLLCFGDTLAYKIRCINLSSGTITGFGTGNPVSAGDGGTVGNASFHDPQGVIFIQRTTVPPNGIAYDLCVAGFCG